MNDGARFGQKPVRPSKADERRAYDDATARDGGRCVRCDWFGTMHRDHRKNRSQGGLTVVSNLQLLCGPHGDDPGCHHWATVNPREAMALGFAVPSYARTEFWPAWRFHEGWVVYFDAPDENGDWWRKISQFTADQLMNRTT